MAKKQNVNCACNFSTHIAVNTRQKRRNTARNDRHNQKMIVISVYKTNIGRRTQHTQWSS